MSIVNQIVDRQHVSASNVDVIRAIRKAFSRDAFGRIHRAMRKRVYAQAIKRHTQNGNLYAYVMQGRRTYRKPRAAKR